MKCNILLYVENLSAEKCCTVASWQAGSDLALIKLQFPKAKTKETCGMVK